MFPQIFGKYVLERELAAGGMARVYLATLRGAVGFEKRLVVKQIRTELASDDAFVQRFIEEAKTAVELSHPNIVPVYELGVEQGVYYIAMEFCAGVTLAELLAESGKLSPEEGAYLGVEICRALDYAHRRAGIVHRDVTPRNVLLDEEGAVRLIDFGIALPVARDGRAPSDVFGSPGHMPPEQLAGKALSPAADVFAVAALLVEAWAGRPPFRRGSARESEAALYESRPPLAASDPALGALDTLIQGALALDPGARPQEAELFARPLRDFLRAVDSGDLARRLGARVRRAARHLERRDGGWGPLDSGESIPSSAPVPRPSEAPSRVTPHAAMTCTFARRDEVAAWAHPGAHESSRDDASGPSTRKLPSITPPTPAAPQAAREKTPLRGVGGVLAALTLAAAVVWVARAPGRDRSEPKAIAAPRAHGVASSSPPPADTSQAPSAHPEPPHASAPDPSQPATPSQKPDPSQPATPTQKPDPLQPATPTQKPDLLQPKAPTQKPAAVGAGAPTAHTTAMLRLTADPPALVRVEGKGVPRTLRTPVRELRLPAGAYTVTFQSETYGAPVVARLRLEADTQRSIHADFREADPRLTVR